MIKTILIGVILIGAACVQAQNVPSTTPSMEQVGQEGEKKVGNEKTKIKKTAEERATLQTEKIKSACGDISADQEAKIKAIFLARATKVDEFKASGASKDNKKDVLRPMFRKSNEELKIVLSAAQFEKVVKNRKSNKNNKGKNRGNKPQKDKDKSDKNSDNDSDDDDDNDENDGKEEKENKNKSNKNR